MFLLTNADVYAPAPLGPCHLLIAGERIVWMGAEKPDLPASLEVEERDLQGLRVIPGLVDAHTHLIGGGGETGYASRVPPLMLSALSTAGVTTAVGLLGTDDIVHTPGALYAAARGLRELGLTTYCWAGGYHVPPVTLTGSVRGDMVHVDLVIGVGELAISDHRSSQPTFDELVRIAGDVHVGGIMTGKAGVLHLHLGDGERGLELVRRAVHEVEVPARVYHPTHVNRRRVLLEEAFDLVNLGCTIDVSCFPPDDDEDTVNASDAIARYLALELPPARLTASSDGGGCLPVFDEERQPIGMDVATPSTLLDTLRALLAQDLPLERVLPVFTSNVASHLKLPRKGTLEVGGDADLVVLDDDVRAHHVMARGRWLVEDGRAAVRGPFETP
ncbi:MAG: beta-aspartyl-peptidase [Planctomycetota bacterium]|nr:beta-aspartyl-peptidase [Planctomycetota bacterium]